MIKDLFLGMEEIFVFLIGDGQILSAFMPLITILANLIKSVIAPVLKVLYALLEPIFTILNAIIEAIKWILDHTVGWLMDIVNGAIDWFSDTFLGGSSNESSQSTVNNQTTNNVTINTSSSEFDVDSINEALGGSYL